jgi:1-aminocyclopropane-1-carboxylate deaminase
MSLKKRVLGISVLKEGGFLQDEITKLSGVASHRWQLLTEYAYGGYAKRHPAVTAFMEDFYEHTHIPLDFVYTGKMMCAVFDLATKRYFPKGSTVLALHTGGLQGQS